MQSPTMTAEEITRRYTTAIDEICEIGRAYYMQGRLGDAQHLLRTSLEMLQHVHEGQPLHRLKLLRVYGQTLIIDHFLTQGNSDLMFSTVDQTRQIAEETQDQQGIADALSLQGQAHYFAAIVESRKHRTLPAGTQGDGQYDDALAYQQQALKLRETLHDTRGISESYFQIGVVYERWQQYDRSYDCYTKASQIAEQAGHLFERTEPARHFAFHALRMGDLDQALLLAQRALSLREEAGFKPYLPFDHLLLRDVYLALEDTAHAQHHTEMATAIAEEMGLPKLVASLPNIRDVLATLQAEREMNPEQQ